jgi:hypothetical protein
MLLLTRLLDGSQDAFGASTRTMRAQEDESQPTLSYLLILLGSIAGCSEHCLGRNSNKQVRLEGSQVNLRARLSGEIPTSGSNVTSAPVSSGKGILGRFIESSALRISLEASFPRKARRRVSTRDSEGACSCLHIFAGSVLRFLSGPRHR